MPIRPEMECRYPKDWDLRSRFVRFYRAKNKCEWCGAENGKPHPITGAKKDIKNIVKQRTFKHKWEGRGMTIEEAVSRVIEELKWAEIKHPDFPKNLIEGMAILAEEVGEAQIVANDFYWGDGDDQEEMKEEFLTEIAQVGAMALRILITTEV